MVGSIIKQDDGILLPAGRFQIQFGHKVPHEQHERVLVSVGMAEAKVDPPIGV